MSSPFARPQIAGQPIWSLVPTSPGNFSPFPTVGMTTSEEVGYGEGGYGVGGYDSPGMDIQPAPTPIWSLYTLK